jgi:hypothetical protein
VFFTVEEIKDIILKSSHVKSVFEHWDEAVRFDSKFGQANWNVIFYIPTEQEYWGDFDKYKLLSDIPEKDYDRFLEECGYFVFGDTVTDYITYSEGIEASYDTFNYFVDKYSDPEEIEDGDGFQYMKEQIGQDNYCFGVNYLELKTLLEKSYKEVKRKEKQKEIENEGWAA